MEILAKENDWTPNDEERLAAFLDTETGKRLIPALVQYRPGLMAGGQVEAILIRSGEVRAFDTVIESLFFLAHPPARANADARNEYPALDADHLWKDGQKLEPQTPEPLTAETPAQ